MQSGVRRQYVVQYKLRISLAVLLIWCCVAPLHSSESSEVNFFASYSTVNSSAQEHCDGYGVALWKYKESLVGFVDHHRGLCGDPPLGVLEDVEFNVSTGELTFTAKLSDAYINDGDQWKPSKDILSFNGLLVDTRLEGEVSLYSVDRDRHGWTKAISIARENPGYYESYDSHEAWMKYWARTIKFRGPKW